MAGGGTVLRQAAEKAMGAILCAAAISFRYQTPGCVHCGEDISQPFARHLCRIHGLPGDHGVYTCPVCRQDIPYTLAPEARLQVLPDTRRVGGRPRKKVR